MGLGHVPTGKVRQERQGHDVPRREHRGTRADLGSLGEYVAARFLGDRGATIISRNTRIGRGEIDLVVAFDEMRVAVEVKTASRGHDPMHHFSEDKQRQLRLLAGKLRIARIDYVGVSVSANGAIVRWLPGIC